MFKDGLVGKIVTTFTLIVAVTFITIASILSVWFEDYYVNTKNQELVEQSKLIINAIGLKDRDEISLAELKNLTSFISGYIRSDLIITDNMGYIYAVSNSLQNDLINTHFLNNEIGTLREGKIIQKRNVQIGDSKEKVFMYIQPVILKGVFKGAIVMSTPAKVILEPLRKVYSIIWICSVLAIFISSLIIYYFIRKMIISPLAEINYVAKKISKGEVEKRVKVNSKDDEISELAHSFNVMASFIETVEKNRREFISNVSHELRSPITSIKGFIGGILDGVISEDKERYYLSIAYDEIQRLSRLVNDLLDLSAMEAGKFSLRVSKIDINEIIRLCVINFETKLKQKELNVDVVLEEEHLYVLADRDRIIQVVTNLIDNAVKYVIDKGSIKIATKVKGHKVLVSIFNNGSGIPEEDLNHIWDRFYKSDKARTSKVSTGLGLPIIRNILSQLGEDVWVENKEKEGVTFFFTLKRG
jgi:signal transduction histidine kinase